MQALIGWWSLWCESQDEKLVLGATGRYETHHIFSKENKDIWANCVRVNLFIHRFFFPSIFFLSVTKSEMVMRM